MSEESGRCPICGEYLDHYGRSVLCYNTKCPLYLEAGPLVALIGALVDLVQDRPTPIETAPKDRPFYAHTMDGQTIKMHYHSDSMTQPGFISGIDGVNRVWFWEEDMDVIFTGWTPVEEEKP